MLLSKCARDCTLPTESELANNSIVLNWPGTTPEEVIDKKYDRSTEVYYVGKLFQPIVEKDPRFQYRDVIEGMTKRDRDLRFKNFSEAIEAANRVAAEKIVAFSDDDKAIYRAFADSLCSAIASFTEAPPSMLSCPETLSRLKEAIAASALEEFVHDIPMIITCFIDSGFTYYANFHIRTQDMVSFYDLLVNANQKQRVIILRNLATRFSQISFEQPSPYDDDIPF